MCVYIETRNAKSSEDALWSITVIGVMCTHEKCYKRSIYIFDFHQFFAWKWSNWVSMYIICNYLNIILWKNWLHIENISWDFMFPCWCVYNEWSVRFWPRYLYTSSISLGRPLSHITRYLINDWCKGESVIWANSRWSTCKVCKQWQNLMAYVGWWKSFFFSIS